MPDRQGSSDRVVFSIAFDPATYVRLTALREQSGRSLNALVRRAVEAGLPSVEAEVAESAAVG